MKKYVTIPCPDGIPGCAVYHRKLVEDEPVVTRELTRDEVIAELVDRFLRWKLPETVRPDSCVLDVKHEYPLIGTNLLTATEARLMFEHALSGIALIHLVSEKR